MPVTARCSSCGTSYSNVKDELVGKLVKCKKCQQNFIVKAVAPRPAPAPAGAIRPAQPPAPVGQEAEAVVVEDDTDADQPREKAAAGRFTPKNNLVLIAICFGVSFLLCGLPIIGYGWMMSRAVSTFQSNLQTGPNGMPQGFPKNFPQGFPQGFPKAP
jgi:DNA-directed RNA polymerase subunit RPC12/RpoP